MYAYYLNSHPVATILFTYVWLCSFVLALVSVGVIYRGLLPDDSRKFNRRQRLLSAVTYPSALAYRLFYLASGTPAKVVMIALAPILGAKIVYRCVRRAVGSAKKGGGSHVDKGK